MSRLGTYVGNLFHVIDHLIVALGLLAEPREEGLAVHWSDCKSAIGFS